MATMPAYTTRTTLTKTAANGLLLMDAAVDLPELPQGPFVRNPAGDIVCVREREAWISADEGATWEHHSLFGDDDPTATLSKEIGLVCTRAGTIVATSMDLGRRHWPWNSEIHDAPGAMLPTVTLRSLDGGGAWRDFQTLHEDWTGAVRDVKQLATGRLVLTSMKLRHAPGRHTCLTYYSDDEGRTWTASNVIDLGGMGHHGGVTEPTFIELGDGSLLLLLRTNWGQFWRCLSHDGGASWHPMGPSGIDASSAPGMLMRLQSGRIMLMWNRLYPEGASYYPLRGGDNEWSATPVSNHRADLSVSFSADDCATWSQPVVVARHPDDKWISYPYAFEVTPGVLWMTTMQGDLRIRIHEADLLR